MKQLFSSASLVGLLVACASAHAESPPAPPAGKSGEGGVEDCARVTAEARNEGYGYTHLVQLTNTCKKAVQCEVWTDVDVAPHYTLTAKPGETTSVATRKGSPAREFKALSTCRFSDAKRSAR